ncbi:MAG: adenylate/guanylate cyclase domain-containing protein [Bacteroidales bacterium]
MPEILSGSGSASEGGGQVNGPVLSGIIVNGDEFVSLPRQSEILTLRFRENNVAFEFEPSEGYEFQFYLEGLDKKWSSWQKVSRKEYTSLPARNYVLKTRFRSSNGIISEVAPLAFAVKPMWYFSKLAVALYVLFFLLIIWSLYEQLNLRFARTQHMLEQIINKRTEDLIIEKEKSETLLANVLPKNTADEIMLKGKATKIKYNFVTVLFSDIQGFTQIAEEMNPEVLIDELDRFFFHFDSVVEKYRIEKIKTIGDAYMCAGGIPEKNRTNPVEVILAAIEMQNYMKKLKERSQEEGMKYWDIRIGIHTGTVVAGVIGQKKLSYDIWGDTVNTASRMESSGEGGRINISGTTYEFVKDFFICEHRGKMPVKYKGELDMYFVNGIVPELSDGIGEPNREFLTRLQMIKLQDIEELIAKLYDDEAPPNLYFHSTAHVKSIVNQAELLASGEKLPSEDFIILKCAALFLFTGYIYDYEKPAEASLLNVEKRLPAYGFDQPAIEAVKERILNSYNDLQNTLTDRILHDARYDYLGRVDYLKQTEKLFRERSEYGRSVSKKTWIMMQRDLLLGHEFLTGTARLLRSVSAAEQIAGLELFDK